MSRDGDAPSQRPSTYPDERMIAICNIRAVMVVDEHFRRLAPHKATHLHWLAPMPEYSDGASRQGQKHPRQVAEASRDGKPRQAACQSHRRADRARRQSRIKYQNAHPGLGQEHRRKTSRGAGADHNHIVRTRTKRLNR